LAPDKFNVCLQIWARRRNISSYQDPLEHIFSEFDEDQDGYLNAADVTAALGSRNVNITPEQAQMFLEGDLLESSRPNNTCHVILWCLYST